MKIGRSLKAMLLPLVIGLGAASYFTREYWQQFLPAATVEQGENALSEEAGTLAPTRKILLSDQAIASLGLRTRAIRPETFWRSIQVPGMIIDRPGRSDRGVISPATGVIASVNHFPGETVRPGDVLFSVNLLSESLHQTQSNLFKASQDIKLAQAQRVRLKLASGAIPETRMIEVENEIKRLEVAVKADQRELGNRGFALNQVDQATEGNFVTEIRIVVPARSNAGKPITQPAQGVDSANGNVLHLGPTFEVQELKVELGQQVTAGQVLCLLANHQSLSIEGRAFRDETSLLERSVKESWPVEVDFQEDAAASWPPLDQVFHIDHLANTIDPVNRTFAFLMPLENQSRVVDIKGRTQMLWRFRPGQKLRLQIRTERLDNVFVLPSEAVAHDLTDTYVFTQNVNTFERKPVHLVFRNRQYAIVANDGSLIAGMFIVQNAAAQLNRMARSQSSSVPKGYHVHADGSLHKNEDEGK